MLNQKKMLTKLAKRNNFRIATESKSSITISGNNAVGIQVSVPSQGTPLAVVGYLFSGTNNTTINVYGVYLDGDHAQFYVRNSSGSAANVNVTVYYLVTD